MEPPRHTNDTSFLPDSFGASGARFGKVHHGSTVYLTSHLVFTYVVTIIAFVFLQRNWKRYIPLRQLFSLELAHSIPARTVMCTNLPPHLRSERALAEYFEGIHLGESGESGGLGVESVTVTRAVGGMKELLEKRTKALRTLEEAWCKYLGNPVPVEGKKAVFGYDASIEVERIVQPGASPAGTPTRDRSPERRGGEGRLVDVSEDGGHDEDLDDEADLEARLLTPSRPTIINSARQRPKLRPGWFRKKVDALDYYAEQFRLADEDVKRRRKGRFR